MTYLLDREFPFGLENLLLCGKNIEEKGLQIIAQIDAKHIVHGSDELKKLFEIIESKCINKRMWVLLGSVDSKKWLPLQLASVSAEKSDIRREIKTDLKRMIPFDSDKDIRKWTSKFHGAIMDVEIGKDIVCQKYSKLRENLDSRVNMTRLVPLLQALHIFLAACQASHQCARSVSRPRSIREHPAYQAVVA